MSGGKWGGEGRKGDGTSPSWPLTPAGAWGQTPCAPLPEGAALIFPPPPNPMPGPVDLDSDSNILGASPQVSHRHYIQHVPNHQVVILLNPFPPLPIPLPHLDDGLATFPRPAHPLPLGLTEDACTGLLLQRGPSSCSLGLRCSLRSSYSLGTHGLLPSSQRCHLPMSPHLGSCFPSILMADWLPSLEWQEPATCHPLPSR